MLALTIVAITIAVFSAVIAVRALRHARRSADASEQSVIEAKRSAAAAEKSAGAAEKSAGAAAITAEADRAQDHRQRKPRLLVTVDQRAAHDGTEAIYRVTNEGPADLDSVVVHRPMLGVVEGRIVHPVATTGLGYGETAELGPIGIGTYGRFTLSLGSNAALPEFRVKIVSRAGQEEWSEIVLLDFPRQPPSPRISSA